MIKRQRKNRLKSLFGKIFKKTREHDCTETEVDACADGSEALASYTTNAHAAKNTVDIQEDLSKTNNDLHEASRDRSTTCASHEPNCGATLCSADQSTAGIGTANGAIDNSTENSTKEQQYSREAFTDNQSGSGDSQKNRSGHSNSTDEGFVSTSQTQQRACSDPSDVPCQTMVKKSRFVNNPIACLEYVDSEGGESDEYITEEQVAARLLDAYNQPLTPCDSLQNMINLPRGTSPLYPYSPSYRPILGTFKNKNNGNGVATSWERSSRYASDFVESRGFGAQRTQSCRVPLKALQNATDEDDSSAADPRPQVTLRRRSTISSADRTQDPSASTGTVHYHLNIENCDGVSVYVNGTDMCQLPSRSVHVSRVGNVKRLSWVVDMDAALPSAGVAALPADVCESAGKHPWNVDSLDVLSPDDNADLSGTTEADNNHRTQNTRSTDSGISGLIGHQLREPDPVVRHADLYHPRRYGEAMSTQAGSDGEYRDVGIPEVLQRGPDSHPVVIDGRTIHRNLPDTLSAGPRRLMPATSSLPLFGNIPRKVRRITCDGTAHDQDTDTDHARYTPSDILLSLNLDRDDAANEPERSPSTRRITEQPTTQDIDDPTEISKDSQQSINVGSASAKPVAVVTPRSRISESRNGRVQTSESRNGRLQTSDTLNGHLQTSDTLNGHLQTSESRNGHLQTSESRNDRLQTRRTISTDRSRVSAAPAPRVEDVMRDVSERILPTTAARHSAHRERSTASTATDSGRDIHLQTILASIKLQLLRVPGVLIVSTRDSRIAVYLSEDRLNVDGVDRFMRLHGVAVEDYCCELLPRRERPRRHALSGRLAVR